MNLKNGTGHTVKFSKDSIRAELLGDTSYVSTEDERVVIVCDEEQDDVSISLHDDHYESYPFTELDSAISEFRFLAQS